MNGGDFLFASLSSAGAVIALASIAVRAGLADDPAALPHRKLQERPVPAVGGAAILVGLLAASAVPSAMNGASLWPALLVAFAVGLADDRTRGGLPPLGLGLGQCLVAAALVASGWRVCAGEPGLALAASFFAPLVAMNCVNTFDNADGAATALGILGLTPGSPLLAAPLFGLLPFNLWVRRGGAPLAYLGNSGSHLLGILMLLDPIGRVALCLPLLDLIRLALVRLAAGSRPWIGDRRHLAHRLQKAGLPPTGVMLALLAIAAPAVIGAVCASDPPRATNAWLPLAAGLSLMSILFIVALRSTSSPE